MNNKYEFTDETMKLDDGTVLHRIRALKDFKDVRTGNIGGFIEKEYNLDCANNAWVYNNALVYDNAKVHGNAEVFGYSEVCGNAEVYDNAKVHGNAEVYDNAKIHEYADIYDNAKVCGNAEVCGNVKIPFKANITSVNDYISIGPIGSRNDYTTFYKSTDCIMVKCGCFNGNLEEFKSSVMSTHSDSDNYMNQYLYAIEFASRVLNLDNND